MTSLSSRLVNIHLAKATNLSSHLGPGRICPGYWWGGGSVDWRRTLLHRRLLLLLLLHALLRLGVQVLSARCIDISSRLDGVSRQHLLLSWLLLLLLLLLLHGILRPRCARPLLQPQRGLRFQRPLRRRRIRPVFRIKHLLLLFGGGGQIRDRLRLRLRGDVSRCRKPCSHRRLGLLPHVMPLRFERCRLGVDRRRRRVGSRRLRIGSCLGAGQ